MNEAQPTPTTDMNAEQRALAQIHTRTYWPDDETCVIVVGTRAGIETQEYVETEFVFQDGDLVGAHSRCRAGLHQPSPPGSSVRRRLIEGTRFVAAGGLDDTEQDQ